MPSAPREPRRAGPSGSPAPRSRLRPRRSGPTPSGGRRRRCRACTSSGPAAARSLELHVGLETVEAALAAEAGLLVAAERRGRVEAVVGIRPDDACAEALGHREDPRALLGPDTRRETVRRVVRLLDGLVRRAEGEDREHRPEDLLLSDPVALRHVREDRGREEPALLGEAAGRLVDLRALLLAALDQLLDPLQLLL